MKQTIQSKEAELEETYMHLRLGHEAQKRGDAEEAKQEYSLALSYLWSLPQTTMIRAWWSGYLGGLLGLGTLCSETEFREVHQMLRSCFENGSPLELPEW